MGGMEKQRQNRSGCTLAIAAGIIIAIALVAYVLSTGPALRLVQKRYLSESGYQTIYYPLLVITDNVALADGLLTRYCRWWVGK